MASYAGVIEATLPASVLGDIVRCHASNGRTVEGRVAAADSGKSTIAPREEMRGIAVGDPVTRDPDFAMLPIGLCVVGRAIDAHARPLDGGFPLRGKLRSIRTSVPVPSERCSPPNPLWTGVKAIDGLLTIGQGARVGIFGAAASGKSTLLKNFVRGCTADVIVLALIGERGSEAAHWLANPPRNATIVCATSDRCAAERIAAAQLALAHAAILRDHGLHALLILDSFARLGYAFREVAIAAGEPAGRNGFPPSVLSELARFTEVAGTVHGGSLTLLASVLNDGDDRDPLSELARSLFDGHIQLSRALAESGRFPAIDILTSASRTMDRVVSENHRSHAIHVRAAIAALARTEDARALGIPVHDPDAVRAVAGALQIESFLRQDEVPVDPAVTRQSLSEIGHMLANDLPQTAATLQA